MLILSYSCKTYILVRYTICLLKSQYLNILYYYTLQLSGVINNKKNN